MGTTLGRAVNYEAVMRSTVGTVVGTLLVTNRNYNLLKLSGVSFIVMTMCERSSHRAWLILSGISAMSYYGNRRITRRMKKVDNKVVVITGCDSGLGYSFAVDCYNRGLVVVAGCLSGSSEGANKLNQLGVNVWQLDVTDQVSLQHFLGYVELMLGQNPGLELHAVVNNAGVMIFGEFEWQTYEQIQTQVLVNQLGPFRVAKSFLPLLRKYRGRIINISSHCSLVNLPGLSVYGATKSAVQHWSQGLRIEQAKYGVQVITFIPGSFVLQSNILSRQQQYYKQQDEAMSEADKTFYKEYFDRYNQYLSVISTSQPVHTIQDNVLHDKFRSALLDISPAINYKHEPPRYKLYHILFTITPTWMRDYLIQRFMAMPRWK